MLSFDSIKNVLSVIGDLCIFGITIYTFYLKFYCKKIEFLAFSPSYNTFKGDSLSVTVENRSLSPICFNDVYLVFGNKFKINMSGHQEHKIIEPFKTYIIRLEPFSSLGNIKFSTLTDMDGKYLVFKTSKGTAYTKIDKNATFRNDIHNLDTVTIYRRFFNNKLIFPDTLYAIIFIEQNETKTVFINKFGGMSESIGGFNAIPQEYLDDQNKIREIFDQCFEPLDKTFIIKQIKF